MKRMITLAKMLIAILVSSQSFAFSLANKDCDFDYGFPHHFEIVGDHVQMMTVEKTSLDSFNNIQIINQNESFFDLIQVDPTVCLGGAIRLKVGTDMDHWSEIVLVDGRTGLTIIEQTEINSFSLDKIEQLNKANFKLKYKQK